MSSTPISIPETIDLETVFRIAIKYGATGLAQPGGYYAENNLWVSLGNCITLDPETTETDRNALLDLLNKWNTLNLTYSNNQVTINPAGNYACYLWIDVGGGYIEQENQEPFTTNDSILEGLTEPGKYTVFAVDETTMESGYVEFEVT